MEKFRKVFDLSLNDFDEQKLLKELKKAKYDYNKAFDSLFQ